MEHSKSMFFIYFLNFLYKETSPSFSLQRIGYLARGGRGLGKGMMLVPH
jgi:hypothetical protein